jgi:hypothetical protein
LLLTTGLANGAFILTTAPPPAFTGALHADQLLVLRHTPTGWCALLFLLRAAGYV